MKRLQKAQGYLIKCLGFVFLFGFISLGAIGGCSNGGSQDGTQVLTENDFSEDASLSAEADEGIIVNFLEHPDMEKPDRDTGEVGIDIIPYRYTETLSNTFCWEDEDQGAEHFMTLVDSNGSEVLIVEANGECVTEVIEDGDYEMRIHHDGRAEDSLAVFIIAGEDGEELGARNTEINKGLFRTAKNIISETLNNIGIIKEARAQVPSSNVGTLILTGQCPGCRLTRANLSGADLSGVDLEGAILLFANLSEANLTEANLQETIISSANLTDANLTDANLSGADLTSAFLFRTNLTDVNLQEARLDNANLNVAKLPNANLSGAVLSNASLRDANLSGTDLSNARLPSASLSGANLTDANLSGADLQRASLLGAILTNANLTGANLGGATWTNGRLCRQVSIGMCVFL